MKTLSGLFAQSQDAPSRPVYQRRLRVYRNRTYRTFLGTHALGKSAEIYYDDVTPQTVGWSGDGVVSIINDAGTLKYGLPALNTVVTGTASPRAGTRPGIAGDILWYQDGDSLARATVAWETLLGGSGACLSSYGSPIALPVAAPGAIHPLDATHAVFLYPDDGGVGATYWDGSQWVDCPHRFMFPGEVWAPTSGSALSRINYSAVAQRGEHIFVYLTAPSGEVLGMSVSTSGLWTDVQTVVPSDLSNFYVANAFTDTYNRVHLCGQFLRREEQATGVIENLLLWSDDGWIFSMDPFTLFSVTGYRMMVAPGASGLLAADANLGAQLDKPWAVYRENAECLEIPNSRIKAVTGQVGMNAMVDLAVADEYLHTNTLLDHGALVKLDLGLTSGSSLSSGSSLLEWMEFETMLLTGKAYNPKRHQFQLQLTHEATWRTQALSYPFYLEMQAKQCVYDDAEALDQLYLAEQSTGTPEPFCVDFWTANNTLVDGGLEPKDHAALGSFTYLTPDLKEQWALVDYPVIPAFPFDIQIYGWSRTGLPDTNPNRSPGGSPYDDDESLSSAAENDTFQPVLYLKRTNGLETTLTLMPTLAAGGLAWPPKTFDDRGARAGAYPVTYTVTSGSGIFAPGDQLTKIGVVVSSPDPTVFHVERVEIPAMTMLLPSTGASDWSTAGTATSGSTSGSGGTCSVAVVFDRQAEFNVSDDPLSAQWNVPEPPNGFDLQWNQPYVVAHSEWYSNSYQDLTFVLQVDNSLIPVGTTGGLRIKGKFYVVSIDQAGLSTIGVGCTLSQGTDGGTALLQTYYTDPYAYTFPGLTAGQSVEFTLANFGPDNDPATCAEPGDCNAWPQGGGQFQIKIGSNNWDLDYWTVRFELEEIVWEVFDNGLGKRTGQEYPIWLPGGTTSGSGTGGGGLAGDSGDLVYTKKGLPSILFSETPDCTFDYEIGAAVQVAGSHAWGGVVGLASDGKNYLLGRISASKMQICKVREGIVTVLVEQTGTYNEERLLMRHRNGAFFLKRWDADSKAWVDPIFYRWQYTDGPLVVNPLVMHVGAYAFLDVPSFRITSFYGPEATVLGLLPGQPISRLEAFPTGGEIEIDGLVYTYTGKSPVSLAMGGPYQFRNSGNWPAHDNPQGGSWAGPAAEITAFDWTAARTARNNYLLASSAGYAWTISDVEWKPWITTDGQVVWLRHRARVFGPAVNTTNAVSLADKAYLTSGLTGVALKSGDAGLHSEGAYAFLHANDQVTLRAFWGASGALDAVIRDLIYRISALAGAGARFPGDTTYPTLTLSTTETEL